MLFKRQKIDQKEDPKKILLTQAPTKSAYAESFRTLRTNLHFSTYDSNLKSLSITSAMQSEGKTNTVANLGYTMAKAGKKVLLVDTDLRKPLLSSIFDLKGKKGLTDLVLNTLDQTITTGSLTEYSLGDLLQLINHQSLDGNLNIIANDNDVTFYFKNGQTIDVVWNNKPDQSSLLALLVKENFLSKNDAETVLELQKKTEKSTRTILLSMGFVTKQDLEKKLGYQAIESVKIASSMLEGTFTFSKQPWQSMGISIYPKLDFDMMYKEVFENSEELTFIKNAIDNVIHDTDEKNLQVLGAGTIPPNPSEIIASERFTLIINQLKKQYDFVIFDTPPVLPTTDAMMMAPRTDGTVLVVRSGYANKKNIKRVVSQFQQSKLPILGVVLNRAQKNSQDYYYSYYHE